VPEDTDEVVHRKACDMGQLIQRNAGVEMLINHRPSEADAVDIGVKLGGAS
jgi:hypothetical protein